MRICHLAAFDSVDYDMAVIVIETKTAAQRAIFRQHHEGWNIKLCVDNRTNVLTTCPTRRLILMCECVL